jgi:hypothetical protein
VKGSSEPPERRPVTEEDRRQALEGMEEAKRAIAEAMKRPPVEIWSPGKFTEPLGMYEDGSFQPPLTEEQKAHNEEVRRRAREEVRQAREARKDIGTRVSMPGRSQVLSAARQDRIAGVLPGAACGDALGVPYEFQVPLSSDESPRMRGGGLGPYEPGEYSDDTQMAVCIAQVTATGADLREESALDAVAENFLDWAARGATDIGAQTRGVLSSARDDAGSRPAAALRRAARLLHERTGRTAGNGSRLPTSMILRPWLRPLGRSAISRIAIPWPVTRACCGARRSVTPCSMTTVPGQGPPPDSDCSPPRTAIAGPGGSRRPFSSRPGRSARMASWCPHCRRPGQRSRIRCRRMTAVCTWCDRWRRPSGSAMIPTLWPRSPGHWWVPTGAWRAFPRNGWHPCMDGRACAPVTWPVCAPEPQPSRVAART